jgi:hypothetical protein
MLATTEIPEIYAPASAELVVRAEGPFPLNLQPTATNLALPFDEVPPGLIAEAGHVIEIPNDRRVIVQDAQLSNLCSYHREPSSSACIFLTLELENIGGYNIGGSPQSVLRAAIDNHGHYTGPEWYTVGEGEGIWGSGGLAPGQSGSGVLVVTPFHLTIDEIQAAWVIIGVWGQTGWTGWTVVEAHR